MKNFFLIFVIATMAITGGCSRGRETRIVPGESTKRGGASSDLVTLFRRYKQAELTAEKTAEAREQRQCALALARELTEILRSGKFPPNSPNYKEEFERGGFMNYSLSCGDGYETAKSLDQLEDDNLMPFHGIADYFERRRIILQEVKKAAPELKENWLKEHKGQWCDAAGILAFYIVEDRIAPSALGLNAEQTFELLERSSG